MNIIKKSFIRLISNFKIPINYSGLRLETISLLKYIYSEKEHFPDDGRSFSGEEYILCFGDSNTFGWNYLYEDSYPFLLEKKIKSNVQKAISVINLGKGGAKIEDLTTEFLQYFSIKDKITAVFNYGLNNIILDNIAKNYFDKNKSIVNWDEINKEYFADCSERFLAEYSDALKKFLGKNVKIIIIGLYKVGSTKVGKRWVSGKEYLRAQNDILNSFNSKISKIALDMGADFIDLWDIFNKYDEEYYLNEDKFHLNRRAYLIIVEKINDILY